MSRPNTSTPLTASLFLTELLTPDGLFPAERTVVVATHHLPDDVGCLTVNLPCLASNLTDMSEPDQPETPPPPPPAPPPPPSMPPPPSYGAYPGAYPPAAAPSPYTGYAPPPSGSQ